MKFDRIIKGGMIIDGTGQRRYCADIGIKDGTIREIGRLRSSEAAETIDAKGLIVAPGFIDFHTHYDAQLYWDPYCTLSGWHGVTTVAIGNCGFGFAPVRPEDRERMMLAMTRIEAIPYESIKRALPWDWVTFPEYLDSIDRAPKAVNVMAYVGVGPLLISVLGMKDAKAGRMPTDAEHAELRRVLNAALDAGACGWSTQYTPPQGNFALARDYDGTPMATDVMHYETLYALAEVLSERNEGFIQMLHMTGDRNRDHAMFERIAEISGRPVLFTSIAPLDTDPMNHRLQLAWLKDCQERGLRVVGHGFTTNCGYYFNMDDCNLFDNSEAWMQATTGTREERKAKLSDSARRELLKAKVPNLIFYFGNIVVRKVRLEKHEAWLNLNMEEIARKIGRHMVDVFLDLVLEEDFETEFWAPQISRYNNAWLKEVVQDPAIILGASDGGAHTRLLTNGRYSTEAITDLVREHGWITLEDAHWRLSGAPALIAGLKDRGTLTVGAAADIIVYDFEKLKILDYEVVNDFPGNEWRRIQRASGYRYVLVNGEVTIRDDTETRAYSGALIRNGRASAKMRRPIAAE